MKGFQNTFSLFHSAYLAKMRRWQAVRKLLNGSEISLKLLISFHLPNISTVLIILLFDISGFGFGEVTPVFFSGDGL